MLITAVSVFVEACPKYFFFPVIYLLAWYNVILPWDGRTAALTIGLYTLLQNGQCEARRISAHLT